MCLYSVSVMRGVCHDCSCKEGFSGVRCEVRDSVEATHKYPCTAAEVESTACLNNGSCFAMYIREWTTSCVYVIHCNLTLSVVVMIMRLSYSSDSQCSCDDNEAVILSTHHTELARLMAQLT